MYDGNSYAPQSSHQSIIPEGWSVSTTPYWLFLSRSTSQISPSVNGSDVMVLDFDIVNWTEPSDFSTDTWTVPQDGQYIITASFSWGVDVPINWEFVAPYVNYNGGGDSSNDTMKRFSYFNGSPRLFTSDTRIWDLSAWDILEWDVLLSSTWPTTFSMDGSSGRYAHINIQKIA